MNSELSTLNLPEYHVRTIERDGKRMVYDIFRGKYVRLTPEEHVRQQFVHYLVDAHAVPSGLVAIELPVDIQGRPQRADIVIYDREAQPLLLVECKAPDTSISQTVFDQASRYNLRLGAPFLAVTNGLEHYACRIDRTSETIDFLTDLPDFDTMCSEA
ncbi:type I restriction enzyme HsdR N-terminal domain-containing protein [Longibacter salinarum]|nr:type I restriction enzyme HsdR N-terminal domain-containing protein [Longibacter salinarum]